MSGGHYNYAFHHMDDLSSEIAKDAQHRSESYDDGWGNIKEPLPADIINHMMFISKEIAKLAQAAHDLEWMMSGDHDYDSLREQCESWQLSKHLRDGVCPDKEEQVVDNARYNEQITLEQMLNDPNNSLECMKLLRQTNESLHKNGTYL